MAAYFVKKSLKENRSIKDVVLESGIINKEDLDKILDVKRLTSPHGVNTKLAEKLKDRCIEFKEKL